MKILIVVVVAGLAFWFIGSRIIDRAKDVNAVAQSSKDNINEVAGVLREAAANVQGAGSRTAGDTTWATEVNAVCSSQSAALKKLGTPSSVEEIAVYLKKALPIVRSHHRQLAALPPPDAFAQPASRAGRALLKQEALLVRARKAARAEDTAASLDQIEKLRSLARSANPNLIKLGLTDCALPSAGLTLY